MLYRFYGIVDTSKESHGRGFLSEPGFWTFLIAIIPIVPLAPGAASHIVLSVIMLILFGFDQRSNVFKVAIAWIAYEATLSILTFNYAIYMKQCVALLLCMLVASSLERRDLESLQRYLKMFIVVGLIFSYASVFANVAAPINSPLNFPNPDGRPNFIYYLTFSNETAGGFIRPAFAFDEPGAFATIIALWAVLAHSIGRFNWQSLVIIALGLITQSLALLIFLLFMLIQQRVRMIFMAVVFLVAFLAIYTLLPDELRVFNHLLGRIGGGELAQNNRTSQITTVYENLDFYRLLFGALALDGNEFIGQIGDVSSNPFTPLFHFGLFQSLPFYFCMILIVIYALKRQGQFFVSCAFLAILFQRPYYANVGYSMLILINFLLLVAPGWLNFTSCLVQQTDHVLRPQRN